jgi:hypothetical protein
MREWPALYMGTFHEPEERGDTMSDEAKCLCVMGTNGPVGDGWYVIGAMRLGTPLYARVDCPTCRGTGKRGDADTLEVMEEAWHAVDGYLDNYGWLAGLIAGDACERTPAQKAEWLAQTGRVARGSVPPSLVARTEAFIARERAKRTTPEADTVDSLAREMAASTGDSPDHWRAYLVSVCGGIAFSKESRHIWNREPTPGLGDRIAAFTDRERAKRAAKAAECAKVAAESASIILGLGTAPDSRDGIVRAPSPPTPRYAAWVNMYGTTVDMVDKPQLDAAQARIAELERQLAAPRCPWSTLDAALVACAKLDERTIPAVTTARATIAAVRDAVTEISMTAAVGAFGRLAGSASPASTLAASIPAEPVGMASDGEEDGPCW